MAGMFGALGSGKHSRQPTKDVGQLRAKCPLHNAQLKRALDYMQTKWLHPEVPHSLRFGVSGCVSGRAQQNTCPTSALSAPP
jgi:hypothetical protein